MVIIIGEEAVAPLHPCSRDSEWQHLGAQGMIKLSFSKVTLTFLERFLATPSPSRSGTSDSCCLCAHSIIHPRSSCFACAERRLMGLRHAHKPCRVSYRCSNHQQSILRIGSDRRQLTIDRKALLHCLVGMHSNILRSLQATA